MRRTTLTVSIHIDGDGLEPRDLAFDVSDFDTNLFACLNAEYERVSGVELEEPIGGPVIRSSALVRVRGEQFEDFLLIADRNLTVREFVEFFGELAIAQPPEVTLDFGGRGGDAFTLTTVQVLRAVVGTFKALSAGEKAILAKINAERRRAAGDWVDSGYGEPAMKLRQMVLAQSHWYRKEFESVFELPRGDAAKLLVVVGYEKGSSSNGEIFWYDPEQRERFFGGA
ncbi:hypothetical protein [Agromyces subbeticus]|uniref:hypothetical protein n=1 Tax=Agromyces subbeticus TaxID=293890 RepID=UPI0003B39E25|nr:hypothetical protein [Agromyces subbeticus]